MKIMSNVAEDSRGIWRGIMTCTRTTRVSDFLVCVIRQLGLTGKYLGGVCVGGGGGESPREAVYARLK